MEAIYDLLERLNIEESDLPQEIMAHVDALDAETQTYNSSVEAMEADGQSEADIEQALAAEWDLLEEHETKIVKVINDWYVWKNGKSAPAAAAAATVEEKEGSGFATVMFAGLALVLTLGAVNLFKNR
jgi:hypothetical protein